MGIQKDFSGKIENIYATDLKGRSVLIHSDASGIQDYHGELRLIRAMQLIDFTDEHPKGAKAAVATYMPAPEVTSLLNPIIPGALHETLLVKESVDELKAKFNTARLTPPSTVKRPSLSRTQRFFNRVGTRLAPVANFISRSPLPRI